MKRWISILLLALSLCVGLLGAACADEWVIDSPFFQCSHWKPEEVDLSGVREENGRLVGEVKLPATDRRGWDQNGRLFVDCPVPTDFTAEQRVILHVTHRAIDKKDLLEAMKVIGQTPKQDKVSSYNNAWQTTVWYDADSTLDSCYYAWSLHDASSSADEAYANEYAQAKDVMRRLIETLGGTVCESVYHANRRDAAHAAPYNPNSASNEKQRIRDLWEYFDQQEAKYKRNNREHTMVNGLYELYGLPVMDQYYWKEGRDWTDASGASSEFHAAVRDDGALDYVCIDSLPRVESAEPLELPTADWRTLLRQAIAYMSLSNAQAQDQDYEDEATGKPFTIYASYGVITGLKPCWVGTTSDTLVPGWYCVTEERVWKDDSVSASWSQYGDAETLMKLRD